MKAYNSLKLLLSWTIVLALTLLLPTGIIPANKVSAAEGNVYYVDSVAGSDSNNGLSPDSPWKNLSKVNSRTFLPGDMILFKSGGVWNGTLKISSSGNANNQIVVGKYGEGPRPIINGGGATSAIEIVNKQYVTIRDLELTNYNLTNPEDYETGNYVRSGVWIQIYHNGPMNNIQLINLDIHDVTGVNSREPVLDPSGKQVSQYSNAAIMANCWEWQTVTEDKHAYYNNFLVEGCYIHDIRIQGISMDGYQKATDTHLYHKNVVIRNNIIARTGNDGVEIGAATNPLIEYNAAYDIGVNSPASYIAGLWVWKTNGSTFQYNEVARVQANIPSLSDSTAFDVDLNSTGVNLFQYNYSHENEGGFTMDMGALKDGINIYRYNISQNDGKKHNSGHTVSIKDPTLFYNNVFYNDNGDGFTIRDNPKATFINNIFYTSKGNLPYPAGPSFYNNNFFGSLPPIQGIGNLIADPKFVDPGKGSDGINTVDGYKLMPDSPLIGAGRVVPDNGGKDFWGNPVYTGSPDIGAFEDPDSTINDTTPPAKPTGLAVTNKTDTTVTLTWNAIHNNIPLDVDIYNASDHTIIASVMGTDTYTLTELTPDTDYSFYIVAKSLSGVSSPQSDTITVKTSMAAIIVDDTSTQTTVNGTWNVVTTNTTSYGSSMLTAPAGTGSNTVTWTPDLPVNGYYSVYCWLPKGGDARANNVPFTVQFDGGSKTYLVNEKIGATGRWELLGVHKFTAGTSGSVTVTDEANGAVAADAVKFLYLEEYSPDNINRVEISTDKRQLKLGGTMALSVMGVDAGGISLDLVAAGYNITYSVDSAAVSISDSGIITGVAEGSANIHVSVTINGTVYSSNTVEVIVGPALIVGTPSFTDAYGNALTSLSPYQAVNVSVDILNSTDIKRQFTLIAALYNSKGLMEVSLQEVVIESYDYRQVSTLLMTPENISDCYIKTYVWDNIGDMRAYSPSVLFPQ